MKIQNVHYQRVSSMRQTEHPDETQQYYDMLTHSRSIQKCNYIVIVGGDLNAKLGLKREDKTLWQAMAKAQEIVAAIYLWTS